MWTIVVLALFAIYLFLIFPALRRHPDRVWMRGLFIAHRGVHNNKQGLPENSLIAFTVAKKLGFCIELDVRLSADGQPFVFHDETLERLCGREGSPEQYTFDELHEMKLSDSDQHIPHLSEVLKLTDGEVPLLIELKCDHRNCKALCRAVDALMQEYNGKYLIESFYPPALLWYRLHRRKVCRGILGDCYFRYEDAKLYQKLAGLLVFNFLARPDFVSYCHKNADVFSRGIVAALGAFPIGWTYTDPSMIASDTYNKAYIFENFIPDGPYREE